MLNNSNPPLISDWAGNLIGVSFIFLTVISILGNLAVILILGMNKSTRRVNLFQINLAICEISSPIITYWMTIFGAFLKHWPYGKIGCNYYGFTSEWLALNSISCLAAISLERYLIISRPFLERRLTIKMKITFALATWVYSFLLAVPPLFGISRYTIEGYGIFCCFDYITRNKISRSYMFYLFWGGFIIPLIAIAFSYTKIFFHVRCSHNFSTRHQNGLIESSSRIPIGNDTACSHGKKSVPNPIQEASLKEQMSQSSSSNASSQTSRAAFIKRAPKINVPSSKHEVQLAKVIGLATLAFVVSSIPYSVMSLITQFGPKERVPPTAILIGNIFAKLSIVYNPFIYWCNDPKFRRKLKKAFFSSARLESGQN